MNYVLQWSETNEGFPEMEYFEKLMPALVRLQQLSYENNSPIFVADIYLDTQDQDGKLHEICEFNLQEGFTFSTDPLPDFVP